MIKRFLYLGSYLVLLLLLTGPVIVQQATGTSFVRTLPFAVGYFLMAANALPLAILFAVDSQPWSSPSHIYWLLPLMALQLWPLLYLALHPALPATTRWRRVFLAYSIGLPLLVLVLWLVIAMLPSLG